MAGKSTNTNRKCALVTGASGGIGECLAYEIARDGHDLVLTGRRESELERVADAIRREAGVEAIVLVADLEQPDGLDELVAALTDREIVPGLVVNNAGFGLTGAAWELDRDAQLRMIDLNIRVLTDLSLRFLPAMRTNGAGGIINIASVAGFMPGPFMAVYYATKAFVISFSEALSRELKGSGVSVTAICPGATATGFQERAGMTGLPLEKFASMMTAEEVARIGYRGFKSGKRVAVTGLMNTVFSYLPRIMPRRLMLAAIARLQR